MWGAGHSEKVSVTHIRTPAQFYVQLGSRRGELDTMCRQINQHCRSQQFRRDLPECVDVGENYRLTGTCPSAWT